ncbi:hypothetical protein DJ68_10910, partial [Halorubrum sp. C3]
AAVRVQNGSADLSVFAYSPGAFDRESESASSRAPAVALEDALSDSRSKAPGLYAKTLKSALPF